MQYKTERSVNRENNKLYFYKMNHPVVVSDFLRAVYDGTKRGYKEFDVIVTDPSITVYPNACLPIAAIIEYYKSQGIEFTYSMDENCYLKNCGFVAPLVLSAEEISNLNRPFDIIVKYTDSAQVASFTQKCVDYISHHVVCENGILESLIWCINEVMANVLVHSKSTYGYVLAQFHEMSKHIAICVSDTGVGIYNSLKTSKHRPARAIDALSLAVQEGIGDGQGQGNGLFGLYQIITTNGGRLSLTSGPASLMLNPENQLQKFDNLPFLSRDRQCTIVDFQMDLNKPVDINTAFASIGGFDGFDIRIDNMWQDDDILLYDVFENCEGTATREAGKLLRNDVINIIKRTSCRVQLDFSKVKMASSSFVDEFLAKMLIDLGVITFNQMLRISGMNSTVKHLSERSIYMRIAEEWGKTQQCR